MRMEINIDKIDSVVARTGSSYKDAKLALEKAGGDVIEAIILLEDENKESIGKEKLDEIINEIKKLVKKGNVTKVVVRRKGKVILNIPVTLAALASVLYIKIALLGLGLAVISESSIEVVKDDGEIIQVNDFINKKSEDTNIDTSDYIDL